MVGGSEAPVRAHQFHMGVFFSCQESNIFVLPPILTFILGAKAIIFTQDAYLRFGGKIYFYIFWIILLLNDL